MIGNETGRKEVALVLGHRLNGAVARHGLFVYPVVVLVALRIVIHIGVNPPFAYLAVVVGIGEHGVGILEVDVAHRLHVVLLDAVAQYVLFHRESVVVLQPSTPFQFHSHRVVIVYLPVHSRIEEHSREILFGLGISRLRVCDILAV